MKRASWSCLVASLALAACSVEPASPTPGASVAALVPTESPTGTRSASPTPRGELTFTMTTFPVPAGSAPHDVAPAADGGVWYTAQRSGELGWLDPDTGEVREVALGPGSSPHGVIVGPDGAPWITDSGLNAIVRVDPQTFAVSIYRLPSSTPGANLNTAAFDGNGILWFTGQTGYYGRLDPASGAIEVFPALRGAGPYGITATPAGHIFFGSLAGSYVAQVNIVTGAFAIHEPPTAGAGARRVWSDSRGRIWVAEWFAGQVAVVDSATGLWQEWPLPGAAPQAYAVYVDETDAVWLTDFGANAIVRFDPETESFRSFPLESQPANVRQLLGRPGEVWGAESAADQLVVVRFGY